MTLESKRAFYLATVVISGLLLIWTGKLVWAFTVERFLCNLFADTLRVENRLDEPIRFTPIMRGVEGVYFLPEANGPFERDNVFDPHDRMRLLVAPGEACSLYYRGRDLSTSKVLIRQGETVQAVALEDNPALIEDDMYLFNSTFALTVADNATFTEATPAMLAAETKAYWRWALLMVVIFVGFFAPFVFPVALARFIRTMRQIKMIRMTEGVPDRGTTAKDDG
jgi:hypothetical protein